jgi:hypothetical protein
MQVRAFAESIGANPLGWDDAVGRVLDFLDDVDAMIRLAGEWPIRRILGLEPRQRIGRWSITVRLSERAECDPEFRRVLHQNPRGMGALAYYEGLGIPPTSYLWEVRTGTVLDETPGLHWVVLPVCHNGCQMLETPQSLGTAGPCMACGNPRGETGRCPQIGVPDISLRDQIHEVDEHIIRLVQADPSARQRVLHDGTGFFGEIAESVFKVPLKSMRIHEVRVAEETESSVCFVLLARHEQHTVSGGACIATISTGPNIARPKTPTR